jgi:hypothetical protein
MGPDLRRERSCREHCDGTKQKSKEKVVTRFHFKGDRLSRSRTGSLPANDVVELSQAARY